MHILMSLAGMAIILGLAFLLSSDRKAIRLRVVEAFAQVQAAVAYCLRAAVKAGEIAPSTDCDEVAAFIVASAQGARLLAKAQRSPLPVERFKEVVLLPGDRPMTPAEYTAFVGDFATLWAGVSKSAGIELELG